MAGEAQLPGREIGLAEYRYTCYRYYFATQYAQSKRVLEVGCGAGIGLHYLTSRVKAVVGGDYSLENLGLAREHYRKSQELVGFDAHFLPFSKNSFDVLLALEIAHYLEMEVFLLEAKRVLAPQGTLVICLPNPNRPNFVPSKGSRRYYTINELAKILSHSGYQFEIYGLFRIPEPSRMVGNYLFNWSLAKASALLNIVDPILHTRRMKTMAKKLIGYKPYSLPGSLTDEDMQVVMDVRPVPLSARVPDGSHMFLYAVAQIG